MYAVKKIIFITRHKQLYDVPDNVRKIHGGQIPSLGGIGIFAGYMVAAAFFMYMNLRGWNYIIASSVILFFTGIYDDIMNMRPSKKLVAQLLASAITVYFADIRIVTLSGLFGMEVLPYWMSFSLTTICCTFFINAFNFIDGIDGLACAMTILCTALFGGLFAAMSYTGLACMSFSITGAALGLLYYNIAPAKIYMGDTGSMFLGFTIFILAVVFSENYNAGYGKDISGLVHSPQAAFVIAIAILFMPIYDAIRVFILRMAQGKSPLKADRTHLHYYLLDAGFTHSQSVTIILLSSIAVVATAFLMQDMHPLVTLASMSLLVSVLLLVIYRLRQRKLN